MKNVFFDSKFQFESAIECQRHIDSSNGFMRFHAVSGDFRQFHMATSFGNCTNFLVVVRVDFIEVQWWPVAIANPAVASEIKRDYWGLINL